MVTTYDLYGYQARLLLSSPQAEHSLSLTVYIAKIVKILRHKQMLLSFFIMFFPFLLYKKIKVFLQE